jgi:hypothetical protein
MAEEQTRAETPKHSWLRGVGAIFALFVFATLVLLSVIFHPGNRRPDQQEAKDLIRKYGGLSGEKESSEFVRLLKQKVKNARFKRVYRFLDRVFPLVLDHVRLERGAISTQDLAKICAIPTIRSLDIPGPKLTAVHWRIITSATNIEGFHVNGPAVHIPSIPQLSALPRLRHLSLENELVTDDDLSVISSLTNLMEISLSGSGVAGPGLTNLRGLRRLAHLDISDTPVTDDYLSNLSGLTTLESLSLGAPITDAGIPNILPLKNLKEIGFMNSMVDNPGINIVLKSFPKLKKLTISHIEALMSGIDIEAYPHVTLDAAF